VQNHLGGKPVAVTADPTCCSGSRATAGNGTGGRHLLFVLQLIAPAMVDTGSQADRSQAVIRAVCKNERARLAPGKRRQASRKIADKILSSSLFLNAKNIAVYIPMKSEVDTWPIIKRAWQLKKRVFAPIMQENFTLRFHQFDDESELFTNKMGFREPVDGRFIAANTLDLVFAPLVAFDSQKNRIGMGGGYYDRTFAFLGQNQPSTNPVLAGLAFECQRVEQIVANPWDIRLFSIFTESSEL
jgi:5-formyltetrahydrofolate cyclo-ligase